MTIFERKLAEELGRVLRETEWDLPAAGYGQDLGSGQTVINAVINGYRTPPAREIPWGERGRVRYACMSYGLWLRHIYYDLRGKKPAKKKKKK